MRTATAKILSAICGTLAVFVGFAAVPALLALLPGAVLIGFSLAVMGTVVFVFFWAFFEFVFRKYLTPKE